MSESSAIQKGQPPVSPNGGSQRLAGKEVSVDAQLEAYIGL